MTAGIMTAPDCCGQRMLWRTDRDEVECGSCNRTVSGEALHAARDEAAKIKAKQPAPIDPLDVLCDGMTLRNLLLGDEFNRRESGSGYWRSTPPTPAQRVAVSAHWSAELRAKVAATKQAERCRVTITHDEDD